MLISRLKYWTIYVISTLVLASILTPSTALAEITTYESFMATNPSKIELTGDSAGEQLGAAIIKGDFNGDGVDDLGIGSPFSSIEQREFNGKVSIFFGKKNIKLRENYLNTLVPDIAFYGAFSGDQLGTSLTAGDFNNDGIDDITIGAFNAYHKSKRPGKVYIVSGQKKWDRQSYDFLTTKPDTLFMGVDNDDGFGMTLSTVDINNDNVDDLMIGSPFSSSPEFKRSGIVYGFFGGVNLMSTSVNYSDEADLIIYGNALNERFGSTIAGGKIFDKNMDLIIGAYTADDGDKSQVGKVYLYKSSKKNTLNTNIPYATLVGTNESEWFGFEVASADINDDGQDDILVTSFPYNGLHSLGKASVFYSKEEAFKRGSVTYAEEKNTDMILKEPRGESLIGASIVTDYFNKNESIDIVVGAPGIGDLKSSEAGDVYMISDEEVNKTALYSADGQSVTSTIHGESADDWFGSAIESLDFNNDGYKDLAIGSRYSNSINSSDNGKVFILFGKAEPYGKMKTVVELADRNIGRGKVVHEVIEKLDLKTKKAELIGSCYEYKEFCLFNFMAMSLYSDIQLEPRPLLYPDVPETYEYYEDIVIGTMLGLINGSQGEKDTPFHPEYSISRINALKIILSAADLVKPKYRFELIRDFGGHENLIKQQSFFEDVDPAISTMWWYPRYTNFAFKAGIIPKTQDFRPHDKITIGEFDDMLEKTLEYLNSLEQDEEAKS